MSFDSFSLAAPPNFRGLHPDRPVTVYHRHLPHWRQVGATYFVTFRLGEALPQSQLELLKRMRNEWERTYPPQRDDAAWKVYAREVTNSAERWLDEGYGVCHFRERRWCDDLRDRLHYFQDRRYFLSCWTIMPNHCHAVIRPFDDYALEDLIGAMKGVTARQINVSLRMSGTLWEDECYDRIVRDEEHLWRVIQYIGRNLRLAGLFGEVKWRRWIHPDWKSAGWRFTSAMHESCPSFNNCSWTGKSAHPTSHSNGSDRSVRAEDADKCAINDSSNEAGPMHVPHLVANAILFVFFLGFAGKC